MENESLGQRALRKTKSFVKKVLITIFLLAVAFFSAAYFATYENGVMAGKVVRVSEKGVLFKTFEGKLSLETFGALKGTSPIAETFDFSVESAEDAVIKDLQAAALSGERVNLYYKKRFMRFFWRGETNVFVNKVERLK